MDDRLKDLRPVELPPELQAELRAVAGPDSAHGRAMAEWFGPNWYDDETYLGLIESFQNSFVAVGTEFDEAWEQARAARNGNAE